MIIDKIVLFLTIIILTLGSCSCNEKEEPSAFSGEGPRIALRMESVGSKTVAASTGIVEKIRTLRIIMLSDGFIEYNAKIDYSDNSGSSTGEQPAATFSHLLDRPTVAGNKKFYIIANEESVRSISFDRNGDQLPTGISDGMSLSDFLNRFTKDKLPAEGTYGYSNAGSGKNFEELLNSAYFTPDYAVTNNSVYLLYTAYYDGIAATDDRTVTIEKTMYMVPAAAKFTFNLKNFRREKVRLHEITLSSLHSSNFVMANLDESELNKNFEGKSYYWIYWLQKVAEGTKDASDLPTFNDKSGWIENYSMPSDPASSADYLSPRTIEPAANETWTANELTNKDNPDKISFVRYFPESKNMGLRNVFNKDKNAFEEIEAQVYKVRFKVEEIRDGVIQTGPTVSDDMELQNVKALFRGTHVILDVDMYESIVEIYDQIEEWNWNSSPTIGYVQEDEDDD